MLWIIHLSSSGNIGHGEEASAEEIGHFNFFLMIILVISSIGIMKSDRYDKEFGNLGLPV